MTILEAIKAKCLDCCCDDKDEVKLCTVTTCPLYEFRLGHDPNRVGVGRKGGNPTINENPKKH